MPCGVATIGWSRLALAKSIRDGANRMSALIPPDLEAARVINAAGTLTRLSGARASPRVAAAMAEAAQQSFDMWALQAAASKRIAAATGAEAGLVTTGASAGLTLAAAAAIAGLEPARMQALPGRGVMANEIVVPRTHRNGYDRALAAAGAVLVDVGNADRETGAGVRGLEAWEVEAAVSPLTVALLASASPATERDIPVLAGVAARRGLPLVVDAAAQLPPVSNLRAPITMGASLVVFSGGKAIGGPQASGILAGKQALVASAALQMLDMDVRPDAFMAPAAFFGSARPETLPRHGIGRGFKASKEAIVGLMVALEEFLARDQATARAAVEARLAAIAERLAGLRGLSVEMAGGRRDCGRPRLAIRLHPTENAPAAQRAVDVCRRLAGARPPVHVGEGRIEEGVLLVDLVAVEPGEDEHLARALGSAIEG
jgi:L-seryl-tRNA(Ser) seleniumtransferase